jgi:hypothetical protein
VESPYGQHHYDPVKSVMNIRCNHGRQSLQVELPGRP